jgi:ribosomal protein L37E
MGRGEAELLRRYLEEHDAPCQRCGYNLRGLKSDECPECGLPISLRYHMEQDAFRQWREARMPPDRTTTLGMIGALTGMGWPVVFAVILGAGGLGGDGRAVLGFAIAVAALVQLVLALLYLERGSNMGAWRPGRKRLLALLAWGWGPGTLFVLAIVAVLREG